MYVHIYMYIHGIHVVQYVRVIKFTFDGLNMEFLT